MAQISEKWQIQVGKNKHIVSGVEKDLIVNAGEARFIKLKDLVVNPAFVMDIVLLERVNEQQIEAPVEVEISEEQRLKNREYIKRAKQKLYKHKL